MEIPENLKTVDGIVAAMREEARMLLESTGSDEGFSHMADLLEEAVKQERIKRDKVSFRCGDCARFGNDCSAGDVDGNEDRVACERFVRRGDAALFADALREVSRTLIHTPCEPHTKERQDIIERINTALVFAPARNCDRGREAAEDAFTAEFGRPWTEEEARVAAWLFEEAGRTGTHRQDADGRAT